MNRLEHIRELLESRQRLGTHWDGCEIEHIDCAAWRLLGVAEAATVLMEDEGDPDGYDDPMLRDRLARALDKLDAEVPA